MAVSSGFFNSVNHDRLYNADQLSSIFDGVITEGVYLNVGSAFKITPLSEANDTVIVGTGRAWFMHTWTYNDSDYTITLEPPNNFMERIDAIVIDVDKTESVRKNSILYVQGTAASGATPPVLINEDNHKQYPIAYITRPAGTSSPVLSSQIQYLVGISCPVVTGPLEVINSENFFQQMQGEFDEWFNGIMDTMDENVVTNILAQIEELRQEIEDKPVGILNSGVTNAYVMNETISSISSFNLNNTSTNEMAERLVTFLPDGTILSANYGGVSIFSSDGVKIVDNHTPSCNIDNKLCQTNFDLYPITFKTLYYEVSHNAVHMNHLNNLTNGSLTITAYVQNISITSDHVVSNNTTSTVLINNVVLPANATSENRNDFHSAYRTESINAVPLDDGSYFSFIEYAAGIANTSYQYEHETYGGKYFVRFISLSDDGIVTTTFSDDYSLPDTGTSIDTLKTYCERLKINFIRAYTVKYGAYGLAGAPGIMLYKLDNGSIVAFSKGNGADIEVSNNYKVTPSAAQPTIENFVIINSSGTSATVYNSGNSSGYDLIESLYLLTNNDSKGYLVANNDYTIDEVSNSENYKYVTLNGIPESSKTRYADHYYIGASNISYDIEFGSFIGVKKSDYYSAVSPTGCNVLIGNNGGTAVIKKGVATINTSQLQNGMYGPFKTRYEDSQKVMYIFTTPYYTKNSVFVTQPWTDDEYTIYAKRVSSAVTGSNTAPIIVTIGKE